MSASYWPARLWLQGTCATGDSSLLLFFGVVFMFKCLFKELCCVCVLRAWDYNS